MRTALKGLGEPERSKDLSHQKYSRCKFYGKHCQGNREVDLKSIGPTIRAEHHGNIEFRRLNLKNGGAYEGELARGYQERRLSPRECARIQTFPDEYEFVMNKVSASEAYKLIGNAVPPLLAYRLISRAQSLWGKYFQ